MQTDTLIEGMNALGYQISNFTPTELAHGYDAFLAWQEQAGFELISANVVWQDSGEPVVSPTAIRKIELREGASVRSVRLGFLGLTRNDPAFMKEGPEGRRIVTVDPFMAAAKYLPALLKKADATIALVDLDLTSARLLPKRAKGFDLVLGGDRAKRTRDDDFPEDTRIGRTRLMYVGHQGMHLGEVRIRFNEDRSIARTERHTIQLTRDWPDDPKLAELMKTTKLAINDYNRKQALASNPFMEPDPGTPSGKPAAGASATGVTSAVGIEKPPFTGSAACGTCHQEAFAIWKKSRHAHAFDALVKASQDFNPQCVGCHTIGYGQSEGFVDARSTPGLVHVGCESCHGASNGHPETQAGGYGRTTTAACLTCHTGDNSPDYNPATYIPKIRHWTDETASR